MDSMADRVKKYPIVGVCALDCGLCPRHYSDGPSRCPGCCGPGFGVRNPGCSLITCCVKQRNLETCAQCADWSGCEKIARHLAMAEKRDSFISYRYIVDNFKFIQAHGIGEFARLEMEKQELLKRLLESHNDSRSKLFYCLACQILPLDKLKKAVKDAEARIPKEAGIKEKAKIMRGEINALAESLVIEVKLRK